MTKKCKYCGVEFEPTNNRQKYCSECRPKVKKEYIRNYHRGQSSPYKKCLICGRMFKPENWHSKYCSDECRKKAVRQQQINHYWRSKGIPEIEYPCKDFNYYNIPDEICLNCNADYCKYYKVSE